MLPRIGIKLPCWIWVPHDAVMPSSQVVLNQENPDLFKWITGQEEAPADMAANPAFAVSYLAIRHAVRVRAAMGGSAAPSSTVFSFCIELYSPKCCHSTCMHACINPETSFRAFLHLCQQQDPQTAAVCRICKSMWRRNWSST